MDEPVHLVRRPLPDRVTVVADHLTGLLQDYGSLTDEQLRDGLKGAILQLRTIAHDLETKEG